MNEWLPRMDPPDFASLNFIVVNCIVTFEVQEEMTPPAEPAMFLVKLEDVTKREAFHSIRRAPPLWLAMLSSNTHCSIEAILECAPRFAAPIEPLLPKQRSEACLLQREYL